MKYKRESIGRMSMQKKCKVIRTHLIKQTLEKAEEKIYNGKSRNNCKTLQILENWAIVFINKNRDERVRL